MQATFVDLDKSGSLIVLNNRDEVAKLLSSFGDREPFICEIVGENGYKLGIGIGAEVGCVQFSRTDDEPPYLMASISTAGGDGTGDGDGTGNGAGSGDYSFLLGETPTPVDERFCLPMGRVIEIAQHFIETGLRCPLTTWESI